jgi:hypothetical protein
MFGPLVLHEPFCYPTSLHREILKHRGIIGKSQLFELHEMFAPFPRKHLKNTNKSIASNIFVALHKGGRHQSNLRSEPIQEVKQRGIGEKLHTPPAMCSHRGLRIMPKFGQFLMKRTLEPLQLRVLDLLHFSLLLHHGIIRSTHILKIFFKILVFRAGARS